MGARSIDQRRGSGRRRLGLVAAWLGMVALLAQYGASLLPIPRLVAAAPMPGMVHDAGPLADCPYDDAGAPNGIPHQHRQCSVCLTLHMAGTFLAPPPPLLAAPATSGGGTSFQSEIPVVAVAAFARPQPRAPPAPALI